MKIITAIRKMRRAWLSEGMPAHSIGTIVLDASVYENLREEMREMYGEKKKSEAPIRLFGIWIEKAK